MNGRGAHIKEKIRMCFYLFAKRSTLFNSPGKKVLEFQSIKEN